MNTTTATSIRSTARRLIRLLVVLAAGLGATLGVAGPSQAASSGTYEGTYSINSFYGWSAGWAYIPTNTQHYLTMSGSYLDRRDDGYCSVAHFRGVYGSGGTTGWYKLGNNCSTTSANRNIVSLNAPAGTWFNGAQVRVCQSDRYGNVTGACSGAVSATNWRVIYPY